MKRFRRRNWILGVSSAAIGLAAVGFARSWSGYGPSLRIAGSNVVIAFTPDGRSLAVSAAILDGLSLVPSGPIRLVNAESGAAEGPAIEFPLAEVPEMRFPRPILKAEFSPDGSLLAVLRENRDLREVDFLELFVIDAKTGKSLTTTLIAYDRYQGKGSIARGLFSGDGKLLAWSDRKVMSADHKVVVWDLEESGPRFSLPGASFPAFSPDSRTIATFADRDPEDRASHPSCKIWETRTGNLDRTIPLEGDGPGWLPWPTYSNDGRWLAVNSRDVGGKPITEVFEAETGRRVFREQAWSPHPMEDGQTLATVKDNDVQLRDTRTWELRSRVPFKLGVHWESGSEISPEPVSIPGGRGLVVFSYYPENPHPFLFWLGDKLQLNAFGSNRMTLIDGETGQVKEVVLREPLLDKLAWSQDGRKMAMQSLGGGVSIWDLPPRRSWRPILILLGLASLGLGFVFSTRSLLRRWRRAAIPATAFIAP